MEAFIPRFIAAEFDAKWGSWSDNVLSWLALRENHPGFILLRYETMKANPMPELLRVSAFLERCAFRKIDSSPEKLQRAVDLSTPERMRELEKTQSADWVLTKNTRSDKAFVRSAKAGGWKTTLSPDSVANIEAAWGPLMERLGYELAGAKPEALSKP
jgi:desulfoglucosinolate sulfotransferase A/B/C